MNTYQGQWQFPSRICYDILDNFIFGKATSSHFFRVTLFKVSQELLFRSSSFFRAAAFFEELLFQNGHFFSAIFFKIAIFSELKLLPRKHTLRIGNSLVQLPFGTATYRRYLEKSYTFSKQILLHSINIFKKARFWEQLLFQKSNIPH